MADLETMVNWAGYDNWGSLLADHLSDEEKIEIFWELIANDVILLYDVITHIVEKMGFVDMEQVKADAEDREYQEWKDRQLD